GNPPWETLELKEREFFQVRAPEIANADTQSKRRKLISKLEDENPDLYTEYKQRDENIEAQSNFISESGRFSRSGQGKINIYAPFAEHAWENISEEGRTGIVVPTGIATDYHTRDFFADLVDEKSIVSLFDFVNKEKIFQGIPADQRFCLLTLSNRETPQDRFSFSFLNRDIDMLNDRDRRYELTREQILTINPNTKNCPIFESKKDRDITLQLYQGAPVLINENQETNPWDINYNILYNSASDSELFDDNTLEELKSEGYNLDGNIFRGDDQVFLPVWGAKFIHQFNHRFGTFEGVPKEKRFARRAGTNRVTIDQKKDMTYEILPRYWLKREIFSKKLSDMNWQRGWFFAFREIVRATSDVRVAKATICPQHPFVDTAPVLTFECDEPEQRALLFTCFFTSIPFEFALRQSLGGAHITKYILKQLPMPKPSDLNGIKITTEGETKPLRDLFVDYGLQLTWTSHSLDEFGQKIEPNEGPFEWDEEERREMRTAIDAIVAKLFDISREDFEYVLDSYTTLKKNETEEHGYYRKKEECLEKFDSVEVIR
ncbi:MAG: Eco57I restriction-modification methylase domain-containing protein, partial [Halobacteriaceae archaeon]